MWGNMMGWGGGPGFGLWHLLWWVLLIAGIVFVVRLLAGGGRTWGRDAPDRALEILRERYARGEIDKTEFENRKRDLA